MKFQIVRSGSLTQTYFWRIVASNGQTLATSETYYNKSDVTAAIASVKAQAGNAQVEDLTVTSSAGRW